MTQRIAIVGGGIAGLSAAWALARRRVAPIVVLERERFLCSQASGHNAAIFRPLEEDAELSRLALESARLFQVLSPNTPLIRASGLLLLHTERAMLDTTSTTAEQVGVPHERVSPERVPRLLPGLSDAVPCHGLFSRAGGVIDIHALSERLAAACRASGVQIRTGVGVSRLLTSGGRISGVLTDSAAVIAASRVVLAAGAWSSRLAEQVECALQLVPVRRHLAVLEPTTALDPTLPAAWRLDDEVYFRLEGSRALVSPCDATPWGEQRVRAELRALEPLARKLRAFGRALSEASVARYWACLRTFASDHRPVVGPDPRLSGLYWLGGLGGFGMSTGVAAGEVLAESITRERVAIALTPGRFCSSRAVT